MFQYSYKIRILKTPSFYFEKIASYEIKSCNKPVHYYSQPTKLSGAEPPVMHCLKDMVSVLYAIAEHTCTTMAYKTGAVSFNLCVKEVLCPRA